MDGPLRIAQWAKIRWWNACAWYLVTQSEALERAGQIVHVLSTEDSPLLAEARARGLSTPEVPDLASNDPRALWTAIRHAEGWLRREAIDIVNVHSGAGHLGLAIACARAGVPLVRTRGDIRPPRRDWLHRILYRRAARHVVSADCLKPPLVRGLGVDEKHISVVLGGIDVETLARVDRATARVELRRTLGLPAAARVVGMVARLSPVKGHALVLEAAADLLRADPDLRIVFAGGDAQLRRADLAAIAERLGVGPQVHLLGRVPDAIPIAAAFDVAVIASNDSEAICRSAYEYLALGLPILATRIHAIGEVLHEGVARLVPPEDATALRQALAALLADDAVRAAMGERGRAHAERRHSLRVFAEETLEAFTLARRRAGATGA